MRIQIIFVVFSFLLSVPLSSQIFSNINLLGQWDDNSLPFLQGLQYNDIWGYEKGGREYAIMGSRTLVHFLEVTDPTNIDEVAALGVTANVLWRDIKTFGDYAYSVTDGNGPADGIANDSDGLLVFDLSNINGPDPVDPGDPERVTLVRQRTTEFTKCHNIFIDELNGILYAVGTNSGTNLVIYELNTDPSDPTLVASLNMNGGYIHDIYVENHIAYASHLTNGHYIYDMSPVTDPNVASGNPIELGVLDGYLLEGLSHSSWKSGNYWVFADETHGAPLGIVDITDPSDPQILDRFHSNLLNVANPFSNGSGGTPRGPIPHNPFILGDYVYVSHYHDGLAVFDISNPSNVTQVGYYDTFTSHSTYDGSSGLWGAYPYLPSGRILGSDTWNGLHVMELAILPVDWGIVRATSQKDHILVHWTTLQEENNIGFIVQRQDRTGRWEDIGELVPEEDQEYHFQDKQPLPGDNLYRIMQLDADGQRAYSKLVTARWQLAVDGWTVYPSPARSGDWLYIQGEQPEETVDLYSVNGQQLAQLIVQGEGRILLPELQPGTYVLRGRWGHVQRIIVR